VRITADLPLVLGSASPRRRELIGLLGVPFVVRAVDVDEGMLAGEEPDRYLERVTLAKLEAVQGAELTGLAGVAGVLVADTIVVAPGGAVLGKPSGDEEALAMLGRLSGATHEVKTRIALGPHGAGAPLHVETVVTRVTFRHLPGDEMARYVATGEGRDKAGSYAVQGRAAAFVVRIEGSYTAVVGLPLCEVLLAMQGLGWV
jgi:septum formation protein